MKTVVLTGGTSGIGRAAAVQLARAGSRVIVVGRDDAKTARVAAEIRSEAQAGEVVPVAADLASLAAVRALPAKLPDAIDALVLNAATSAWGTERQVTADGFELLFATNYLAPFLLARLLGERTKRIVVVGARLMGAHWSFDDPNLATGWTPTRATTQAKLGLYAMTRVLAKRGATINIIDPGLVNTPYQQRADFALRAAIKLFGKTPERVAETYTWLAIDPAAEGITGKAFRDREEFKITGEAADDAIATKIFEYTERLLGL
jgi:NAD(P)-dependent dehydrogenase (short-subunit alcohol dehydrogenase family)